MIVEFVFYKEEDMFSSIFTSCGEFLGSLLAILYLINRIVSEQDPKERKKRIIETIVVFTIVIIVMIALELQLL